MESGSYLATFLRRQAIQFQGMQTRVYVCSWLFRGCASASFSAASFYSMHICISGPSAQWTASHAALGEWGSWVGSLPLLAHETTIALLILIVIGFFVVSRLGAVIGRKTPRLPNGRLDK